ncbi:hypothetical protein [Thermomonospora umbrina]|uniref:DUF2871 family protein n=1 Tax=Thermomonospora umbrina TaxID=111806 RepID=A0A3D9SHT1_9ACTN|nr:hypothetical protein [Thermomonospora umbrina]REE95247.1 hypothetical protein DFJ69_0630 [Thermomonospora umbrina]
MRFAALAAWLLAAAVGAYLLVIGPAREGPFRQATKVTRYPAVVVLGHPLCALAGLALWTGYLGTGRAVYAWSAFGVLVAVVMLGVTLFTRWLVGGGGRHARGAEHAFPTVAVPLHGLAAAATFVLVLLTALDGDRP